MSQKYKKEKWRKEIIFFKNMGNKSIRCRGACGDFDVNVNG